MDFGIQRILVVSDALRLHGRTGGHAEAGSHTSVSRTLDSTPERLVGWFDQHLGHRRSQRSEENLGQPFKRMKVWLRFYVNPSEFGADLFNGRISARHDHPIGGQSQNCRAVHTVI